MPVNQTELLIVIINSVQGGSKPQFSLWMRLNGYDYILFKALYFFKCFSRTGAQLSKHKICMFEIQYFASFSTTTQIKWGGTSPTDNQFNNYCWAQWVLRILLVYVLIFDNLTRRSKWAQRNRKKKKIRNNSQPLNDGKERYWKVLKQKKNIFFLYVTFARAE